VITHKGHIAIVFSGDLSANSYASRIGIFKSSLERSQYKVSLISMFPHSNSTDISSSEVSYLSFKSFPWLAARVLKVIVGHIRLLFYTLFKFKEYDAILFYNPSIKTTALSIRISSLLRLNTIADIVELFQSEKNTWYNRLGDSWTLKHSKKAVVISKKLQARGLKLLKQEPEILPIVVDCSLYHDDVLPLPFLLGYAGTAASKDGLELVIRGFHIAQSANPKLRLRIIGPKPTHFDLPKLILELNLASAVEMVGSVQSDEVPELLMQCDTLIMNRDGSDFSSYGYPTKLGEYFATKRPVLMSAIGGFSDDFQDGIHAYMYKAGGDYAFAECIAKRYENEALAKQIGVSGYDYAVAHFDKEIVGTKLVNAIKTLINAKKD
jgi:glycosyltransferase involved in cell wall biosynthesis